MVRERKRKRKRKKTRSDHRRNAKEMEKTTQPRSEYNGTDPSKPMYGAVNGCMFDVTTGGSFYGPGGPYAMFAGKEASSALAKMSKNDEDISPSLDGLNETEIGVLNDWENNQVHRNIKSFVFSVKGAIFRSSAMEDQLNQQLPRQYTQRLEHALEIPVAIHGLLLSLMTSDTLHAVAARVDTILILETYSKWFGDNTFVVDTEGKLPLPFS